MTAFGEWHPNLTHTGQKTVSVTIEAGKTGKVSIDIPAGILVTISPTQGGKLVEPVDISLVRRDIAPKNTQELEAILVALPPDQSLYGSVVLWTAGTLLSPAIFADVPPGSYTLCLVHEIHEETASTMSEEELKAPLPVFCQPATIAGSPGEQAINIELPAGY